MGVEIQVQSRVEGSFLIHSLRGDTGMSISI